MSDKVITTEEATQYVERQELVFEVLRDDKVLFECATRMNAQLAQAEIERLESQIAQLEAQIANFQQQIDFMRGNANE